MFNTKYKTLRIRLDNKINDLTEKIDTQRKKNDDLTEKIDKLNDELFLLKHPNGKIITEVNQFTLSVIRVLKIYNNKTYYELKIYEGYITLALVRGNKVYVVLSDGAKRVYLMHKGECILIDIDADDFPKKKHMEVM